ncbi:XRE family transcriptional regulator [Secundilactobacillus pentosiphilus]|uniref:XRE family transcriptional regulator n=1 Tax=Secundilactobacillus pentosiphilus TaxID=1714682 RepID=A0A1Z5IT36_9LACO|nr:helix-turn-helix transcriptional regulator [Secundilactobacillus pentosiphilus]GAX04591.1 XRE family transcriptional regulator [Secundilactobacillus pentosiphilus]
MTTFERIKELAKMRGYSLSALNDKAGLGTNSIYHWKTKSPSTDSLSKVADVLNVSVDYLLGNTEDETEISKNKPIVDLNKDDSILTFDGTPIPDEDKELIRRLLRGK